MKAYQLIASAAAAVLTLSSISIINYNVAPLLQAAPTHQELPVVNLAAVNVHPGAQELREAALLSDVSSSTAILAPQTPVLQSGTSASFQLLESQVAMPYYSFGNKFVRGSKE